MMRIIKFAFAVFASCILAKPAFAEWYEASSDHFVIYANDRESDVRKFSENLERYHAALKLLRAFGDKPAPSPSNRVTIFVTRSEGAITKLARDKSKNVAGFYIPRAGGSVAFTPPVDNSDEKIPDFSQVVLLHEYAHHYMISNIPVALPLWYSEGFAEYVGTTTFTKDGSVGLGRIAQHRANELKYSTKVPWKLLFDTKAYRKYKKKQTGFNSFYGQSWAVFHYLESSEETRQLQSNYLKYKIAGESDLQAAEHAFGDLNKFGSKVERYIWGVNAKYYAIPANLLSFKPVTLRKLEPGEAAIMPVVMQSRRGVGKEDAAELVIEARKIAAQFPTEAPVLAALAEAEYDAGNEDAAMAAADRAIQIQPNNINALLQKGYVLSRKAESAEDKKTAYTAVRKHFTGINKIEKDHPIPLIYFYQSYIAQGTEPTENAKQALDYASQLSPFDKGLRFQVARQDMQDKRYNEARSHLLILVNDPHREVPADGKKDDMSEMLAEAEGHLGIANETD